VLPKMRQTKLNKKVEEGRLFYEMLISRPLDFTVNVTLNSKALLESSIKTIEKTIRKFI